MKKFLLTFAAATLLLAGCSDDDSGSASSFESHIMIDGQGFSPSPNKVSNPTVVTYFIEGINDGEDNRRGFHLTKKASGDAPEERLVMYVDYPVSRTDADGSYTFSLAGPGELYGSGSYTIGEDLYALGGGIITVDEMENNRFSITFENVEAISIFSDEEKLITGHCEGKFTEQAVN